MKLNTMRKLGLAGALAIAGLLFAPLAASAELNKCSKEITKNAAKVATDAQKELSKCVDGWLKDEDKAAANVVKGKTEADGAYAGLLKAAEKCQKSLVKIGLDGNDISLINGVTEKGKLGKSYQKLLAAVTAGKPKCGVDPSKVFDVLPGGQLDQEMAKLGYFPPSVDPTMSDINVRLMVMEGMANANSTQQGLNRESYRSFQEMGNDRCSLSGVKCDDDVDCVAAHPKGPDTCELSLCPDCIKLARAIDVATTSPTCADNSACDGALAPPCSGVACTAETDCDASGDATTDFCDTAPSAGAIGGPCWMASCEGGQTSSSNSIILLEGALVVGGSITTTCDDGTCAGPIPVPISLRNDSPTFLCDVQEILPDAVALVSGGGRGLTALVTLTSSPVCVDSMGYTGYVDKLNTYPQFDVVGCSDVDKNTDWGSGAGAANGCAASSICRDEPVDYPPGTLNHTGVICQDLTPAGAPAANHGLIRNDQILTTGTSGLNPCDPATRIAAGEPNPLLLTTHTASGNLWDVGPLASGAPLGGLIIEPGTVAINNTATGSPFLPGALAGGALDGAMVTSFSTIATDPAASIGAQITEVLLDCNP